MYIAMNRFKVDKNRFAEFETMWKNRDSYLHEMEGFVSFQLLKGPEHTEHVLYASHTVWQDFQSFDNWTHSEAFKKAHANAGKGSSKTTLGHPQFEGFDVVLNQDN